MKKILYTILMCFAVCEVNGQVNLVPNPSFEEYLECPEFGTNISMATFWSNPNGYSPDYFNSCATSTEGYSVPSNYFGFQEARTGSAYAGILTMAAFDLREYIQVELNQSLIQGKMYCITFYVSCSDSSMYASNDIGVYLSEIEIEENSSFNLPFTPQIQNNAQTNPLVNKNEWIEITDNYVAQGNENFIIIGNFKPDNETDTTILLSHGWQSDSYHYIDDVSVVLCNNTSIVENQIDTILMYPNPTNGKLIVELTDIVEEVIIYDNTGVLVVDLSDYYKAKKTFTIELSSFEKGIYFIKIKTNSLTKTNKIILN